MKKNILLLFLCIVLFSSCGKKSSLDQYKDSDYPRTYPEE
tara:strand:- start:301 stop:420 length:120 start_codon:yes stop_codon:yes gene_type:complete